MLVNSAQDIGQDIGHDACGIGFIARLDGEPSHSVVEDALVALARLEHRGGSGLGSQCADGAGIMFSMPRAFMERVWLEALPAPARTKLRPDFWAGPWAVGQFFLPRDESLRARVQKLAARILSQHGCEVLGWRDVPVNPGILAEHALAGLPCLRQALVARKTGVEDDEPGFERSLYIARRHLLRAALEEAACAPDQYHLASLSSRGIIYKGMLPGGNLAAFYHDLAERDFLANYAIFHERFSTNTVSSWRLAQPFSSLAHNGEINTLRSNQANMRMREPLLASPLFGRDVEHLKPVLDRTASDSSQLNDALELLVHGGRSLAHAAMMLVPEPFGADFGISEDKRAFYEYHAALMEPWDGPSALVFTDGARQIGAVLDRNALRPCRYLVTVDNTFILASEAGVLDVPEARVARRGRLNPRRMLLVDFSRGRIITDAECKAQVIYARPYRHWVRDQAVNLHDLPKNPSVPVQENGLSGTLRQQQLLFGYCREDVEDIILPMARNAQEPVGSMGLDTPLAVLSRRAPLLFSYFKQNFAQVTNPAIDPLREGLIMSLSGFLGRRGNLLAEQPEHYAQLRLSNPVLTGPDLRRILDSDLPAVRAVKIPILFEASPEFAGQCLDKALGEMLEKAERAVDAGATIIVLSDDQADFAKAPIPSLLAVSALHQHLLRAGKRHACGIIADSGEAREVMHLAQLIAFGASAVHPRLAFATVADLADRGLTGQEEDRAGRDRVSRVRAWRAYSVALQKGLLKTISRLGISTLRGFQGSQAFEALGLDGDLLDRHFSGTAGRIGGAGLDEIALESLKRHCLAFADREGPSDLPYSGKHKQRKGGEVHLWSPAAIRNLQRAVRENDESAYRAYASESDEQGGQPVTLRALLDFKPSAPINLDKVESEELIVKRLVGAAMSLGSLSPEAHRAIAIACNSLGCRSNSGEGGEEPERAELLPNGDDARSRIRQIASGRFGATAAYLVGADEVQIKVAQGAKPGEGGQLPAGKVTAEIARIRHTTPGVTLISPPPHHDIYSIEDLAQLIYDLKRLKPGLKVSVKLVSGANIGTVACGVAKAGADLIVVSGHDGGTGASPRSAVTYVGLPWELGLADVQAALTRNGLRQMVKLQVDGQLRTGRDLVMAALLGADEFGLGSGLLVALGCCMLRACHTGACPLGVASQDEKYRARFAGKPEHVRNYLRFLARDAREVLAGLGLMSFEQARGRADLLTRKPLSAFTDSESDPGFARLWLGKLDKIRLDWLLTPAPEGTLTVTAASDAFADSLLESALHQAVLPALDNGKPHRFSGRIRNTDRAFAARLSGKIAERHGEKGLRPGTIEVRLQGTAGQSFGAFLASGVNLNLDGEANDYVGKGLSGGLIVISPAQGKSLSPAIAEEQTALGNVALYGATSGELYACGTAGERFAVRNSGASAVVEGVGDHACEYMTGGVVVVLGPTGYNFAAGMSGGLAYVFDRSEVFQTRCNLDGVDLEGVWQSEDIQALHRLISRHARLTGSQLAASILADWQACLPLFLKVTPIEYRKALERLKRNENLRPDWVAATEEVYGR